MLSRLHDEANIQVDCETVDLILANKAVCAIVPTMRCSLSHNKAPKWSKKMFWENDKCFNICTVKDLKSYMLSIRRNDILYEGFFLLIIPILVCGPRAPPVGCAGVLR